MSLNVGKSCCMRIGSRFDKPCANVCTHNGRQLSWVKELRYLGIFIVSSRNFKCSLLRSFYRAANSIFGKIGKIASEYVLIELLKTKCMSILLYGFEVCNLCKRDLYLLDFVVNRFFIKLFRTSDISVITYCREMFQFDLPSAILKKRAEKFDSVSLN